MKAVSISLIYFPALAVVCQNAPIFGILTAIASFLVFSKIEADQNVYDLGFWFTKTPGPGLVAWFRAFGKLESVIRSLLLGLIAWFTFAGANNERVMQTTIQLCVAVLICYLFLNFVARKAHLNVFRWAFVKLSIVIGVVFSTLSVIFRTERRSVGTLFGDWLKEKNPWARQRSVDEKIDQIHIITNDAVETIHDKLDELVGEPTASIALVLFNSQILQGFLVVLFTFVLLLLTVPELRAPDESDSN